MMKDRTCDNKASGYPAAGCKATPGPHLGLFWALPSTNDGWDVIAFRRPFAEVAEIGGFRTLEDGHVDLWRRIAPDHFADYEDFPRGRVNWREADGKFLLLLDQTLRRREWIRRVVDRLGLPPAETLVMIDAHYRSTRTPPAAPRIKPFVEGEDAKR